MRRQGASVPGAPSAGARSDLFVAPPLVPFSLTIPGQNLGTPPNGQGQGGNAAVGYYDLYGNGWATAAVNLPYPGVYTVKVNAALKASGGALLAMLVDQSPMPVGAAWNQMVTATTATDYVWTGPLSGGSHEFEIELCNVGLGFSGELLVYSVTITSAGYAAQQAEPPGNRDPKLQPYSSYSMWNTAQGDGGAYGAATDADIVQLHTLAPAINAETYSIVLSEAAPTDPLKTFNPTLDYSMPLATQVLRLPAWVKPALPVQGGDHHICVSNEDGTKFAHFFGCTDNGAGTITTGQARVDDAKRGMAWEEYSWAAGLIRAEELAAGLIPHMMRCSLSNDATLAISTPVSGLAWPGQRGDYNGAFGQYTGLIKRSSTFVIPPSVAIASLQGASAAVIDAPGSNYAVGDVFLNAAGAWTVGSVDGNGGVLAAQLRSSSAITAVTGTVSQTSTWRLSSSTNAVSAGPGTGCTMHAIGWTALSAAGLVIARALQDYGAIQRDVGGSEQFTLYADPRLENPITALSASGTTCTATIATTGKMKVGQSLVLYGNAPAAYNGTITITAIPSPTTFTFSAASAPGGPGTTFGSYADAILAAMRADLPKILPQLSILRNQSPTSLNGGGNRRQPMAPGCAP